MGYLQVISVAEAKEYLRVDHDSSDREIERMIISALQLIEEKTNHIMYTKSKTYYLRDNCVTVHDGPINTVDATGLATTVTRYDFTNYSVFEDTNSENKTVVLSVGYESPMDIPASLIQAAFEMLDYWYYKNDGKVSLSFIADGAREILNSYTRFII